MSKWQRHTYGVMCVSHDECLPSGPGNPVAPDRPVAPVAPRSPFAPLLPAEPGAPATCNKAEIRDVIKYITV